MIRPQSQLEYISPSRSSPSGDSTRFSWDFRSQEFDAKHWFAGSENNVSSIGNMKDRLTLTSDGLTLTGTANAYANMYLCYATGGINTNNSSGNWDSTYNTKSGGGHGSIGQSPRMFSYYPSFHSLWIAKLDTFSSGTPQYNSGGFGFGKDGRGDAAGNSFVMARFAHNILSPAKWQLRSADTSGNQTDTTSDIDVDNKLHRIQIDYDQGVPSSATGVTRLTIDNVLGSTKAGAQELPSDHVSPVCGFQSLNDGTQASITLQYCECWSGSMEA